MARANWFALALLLSELAQCTGARRNRFANRIVGGIETTIAHVPYLVNLRRDNLFICGGSLVAPSCVLTAAHCVYGVSANSLSIHAGASRLSQDAHAARSVIASYPSPSFSPTTLDMDIAVLRLNASINEAQGTVIGLCSATPLDNSFVQISGWGLTAENKSQTPDQVRTTNVRVVPKRECTHAYLGKAKVTSNMFCAAVRGVKDSCSGDSGGPVVQNGRVCGIVSWGFGCARVEYPGVYTDVNSLRVRNFIRQKLREHCT